MNRHSCALNCVLNVVSNGCVYLVYQILLGCSWPWILGLKLVYQVGPNLCVLCKVIGEGLGTVLSKQV